MKNKLKINFKDKKTIIISILLGLILIGLIIFICVKVFHKDKEITPDNPNVKEFEDYLKDAIKPFDEDSIKDYIDSTDNTIDVDEIYWGANYTGNDSNILKVFYTLSRMIYDDSDLISYMTGAGMINQDTHLGEVKLSIKFINKALAAKFKDTKVEKNTIANYGFYKGINAMFCDSDNCTIKVSRESTTEKSSSGVYQNEKEDIVKTSSGYEITLKYYYYELSLTGAMDIKIYDNAAKGNIMCDTNIITMAYGDVDISTLCGENIVFNKVKYYFDKNYKFIKSEILEG